MKKFLAMLLRHWARTPVKISLTILALALGTGILILSFSASGILKTQISDKLSASGTILYVANGTMESDGSVERAMPSQWDQTAPDQLKKDTGSISKAVQVVSAPIDQISAAGQSWRLRSSVGTGLDYFDIFGLQITSGVPMAQEDLDQGSKRVWISESLATLIFGSPADALGQFIQPPGQMFGRGPGSVSRNLIIQYQVAGIFKDPVELNRKAYGIADMIFPWTSMLSSDGGRDFMLKMFSNTLVVKADGLTVAGTESLVRSSLGQTWGNDLNIAVWEGSPRGKTTYLEGLRQSVDIFSVSVNLLGVVLLILSALGIFSIMVVESLGRRREIALERAIGASQGRVLVEFLTWSVALSGIGAILGAVLALVLAQPVLGTMAPLVGEVAEGFKASAGLSLPALFGGLVLALAAGGILGVLPAFTAVRGNIAETLREV